VLSTQSHVTVKLSSKSRPEAEVCSAGHGVGRASAVKGGFCVSRGIHMRTAAEGGMKRWAGSTTLDVASEQVVGRLKRVVGRSGRVVRRSERVSR
jgi:hypothetical protein